MAIYGLIEDGRLITTGDLPQSARRLDTGEIVEDLPGTGRRWMRATGWFDLAQVNPAELTDDPRRQTALAEAIAAATGAATIRADLTGKARDLIAAVRSQAQQEIADYGPTGTGWPDGQPVTAAMLVQRTELLRSAVLRNDAHKVRLCNLFDVMVKVLERLIASDTTLQPPSDL